MAARKSWTDLSPEYRRRMQQNGLTAKNWNTKTGDRLREKARGHDKTPEHPERAGSNPSKYKDYLNRRQQLLARFLAHKAKVFGTGHKYRQAASDKLGRNNPTTGRPPKMSVMRAFLEMDYDDVMELEFWDDTDWHVLFYH